jgi:hypothetical protein
MVDFEKLLREQREKKSMAKVSMTDFFSDKEFLNARDVKKETIVLTILSAESVKLNRNQLVLRFKETPKSFGLGKKDLKYMIQKYGSETEAWEGKKITLQKEASTTPQGAPTVTFHVQQE